MSLETARCPGAFRRYSFVCRVSKLAVEAPPPAPWHFRWGDGAENQPQERVDVAPVTRARTSRAVLLEWQSKLDKQEDRYVEGSKRK